MRAGRGWPGARRAARVVEWLAGLLAHALSQEPEPLGLLALIRLHTARWSARLDDRGGLVPLAKQDRSLWNAGRIRSAVTLIERAAAMRRPGSHQIEAAITAVHCEAPSWQATDWPQLLTLYDMLLAVDPSPVVRLSRAVVVSHTDGLAAALAQVDALADWLNPYHLFHAAGASLLRDLGRTDDALQANEQALELTVNLAERTLLTARLSGGYDTYGIPR